MLKVYGMEDSGNCYKPCLLLSHLGREYEWISVNILEGESRTPEFLQLNPNGRVPVLEVEPGVVLPESNAILFYLAHDTAYLPDERFLQAQVLRWMFFEQYSHEPFIATSRYWRYLLGEGERYKEELEARREPGIAALSLMDRHLATAPFFVGHQLTIADFALYAYTHVADEGGFSLDDFSHLRAWLERIRAHPLHEPMRRLDRSR